MHCFFIGDSFINGVGDVDALGWRGRTIRTAMRAGVKLTTYDLGVRGHTSADILARWKGEVQSRHSPGAVHQFLFSFGTNDCASVAMPDGSIDFQTPRLDQSQSIANAEKILATAISKGSTVMIGPGPILDDERADRRILEIELELASLAKRYGVPFLPVFDWCRSSNAWTTGAAKGDGTHPDAEGYAALAEYILNWAEFRGWIGFP